LDGHGSHLTVELVEFCEQRNIILFSLPPHSSHFLQPLNIVLFQPFKHYHRQAVEMAMRTGCTNFNIIEFLHALHGIRMATFKQSSILSGWEKAGLIPYNPELVLSKLRTQNAAPERPPTPPPSTQQPHQPPHTPDTPCSIKEYINAVYYYIHDMPQGRIKNRLLFICKSTRKNATLRALAEQDLQATQAAVSAHAKRQRTDQWVVSKGGLISVGQGRIKVSQRVQKDAAAAARAAARKVKKEAAEAAAAARKARGT
jgi:hypothetical protein